MTKFETSSQLDRATNQVQLNTSFAAIPRPLLRDPNFAQLKGNAVKLLLAMFSGYIGKNNGELIATYPVMKTYGFNSKDSVSKALSELLKAGMIIRTRISDYRRPATYAVTWLPVNRPTARGPYDAGVLPTDTAQDLWRSSAACVPSAVATPAIAASKSPQAPGVSTIVPVQVAGLVSDAPEGDSPELAASVATPPQRRFYEDRRAAQNPALAGVPYGIEIESCGAAEQCGRVDLTRRLSA